MIPRDIETELRATAGEYPVITITGPRQSGKTTLVRNIFPDYHYVNLENPEMRSLALQDPKNLFHLYEPPIILDEIQNVPELLSWIQVMSDDMPGGKARFILTSSHQLRLKEAVTQSLAGRTALLTLLPFSLHEIRAYVTGKERNELLISGFMPRIFDQDVRATGYYRNYFKTYVERDVQRLLAIKNQQAFELFMRLLAGRVGQIVNYSSLANQIGMSIPQIQRWVSVLEASFIIFKLPPFFNNYGKRLTKSPKIYFTEVGLAAYLLGLESPEQVERDPAFGGLFENMIVAEAYKTLVNSGKDPRLYFFRDHHQHEIDLLFPDESGYIPIEIKSSRTFREDFLKGIHYFHRLSQHDETGLLIYDGDIEIRRDTVEIRNFRNAFPVT